METLSEERVFPRITIHQLLKQGSNEEQTRTIIDPESNIPLTTGHLITRHSILRSTVPLSYSCTSPHLFFSCSVAHKASFLQGVWYCTIYIRLLLKAKMQNKIPKIQGKNVPPFGFLSCEGASNTPGHFRQQKPEIIPISDQELSCSKERDLHGCSPLHALQAFCTHFLSMVRDS